MSKGKFPAYVFTVIIWSVLSYNNPEIDKEIPPSHPGTIEWQVSKEDKKEEKSKLKNSSKTKD
jgi:hypothetical protein